MKYQPQFPQRFGCIQDAKAFCRSFFDWYNQDHHHAGIGLMTPDQVHYGQANQVHAARQITLDGAFGKKPNASSESSPNRPQASCHLIHPPAKQQPIQA
uniref:Integrase n=1 Tax=Rhodopseudomonas palustris (strain BisA53) TaxID=316055 RepID=Q07N30_RHOP5